MTTLKLIKSLFRMVLASIAYLITASIILNVLLGKAPLHLIIGLAVMLKATVIILTDKPLVLDQ